MKITPPNFCRIVPVFLAASFFVSCSSQRPVDWREAARQSHPWGYYSGAPETRWNSDGRTMTLLRELRYIDPHGTVWVAPAGAVVDGASIPRSLWSFMGGPFEGKYRNASVLHDVSYDEQNRPPQDCDRMFYNAMRCSGVGPVEAKTMYFALLRFGRHWKFGIKRARPVMINHKLVARAQLPSELASAQDTADIQSAQDWIRNAEPSIEQIEARALSPNEQRPPNE